MSETIAEVYEALRAAGNVQVELHAGSNRARGAAFVRGLFQQDGEGPLADSREHGDSVVAAIRSTQKKKPTKDEMYDKLLKSVREAKAAVENCAQRFGAAHSPVILPGLGDLIARAEEFEGTVPGGTS